MWVKRKPNRFSHEKITFEWCCRKNLALKRDYKSFRDMKDYFWTKMSLLKNIKVSKWGLKSLFIAMIAPDNLFNFFAIFLYFSMPQLTNKWWFECSKFIILTLNWYKRLIWPTKTSHWPINAFLEDIYHYLTKMEQLY